MAKKVENKNMIITLIGSRETPSSALDIMKDFVLLCNDEDVTFRSGGAEGADKVVTTYARKSEIYVPWNGFNGVVNGIRPVFTKRHRDIINAVHPAPERLSEAAMKLHMRNINQVLGMDIENPVLSDLVVCWTKGGQVVGGTATAIKIAEQHDIPVINLGSGDGLQRLCRILGSGYFYSKYENSLKGV